jgi:pimeloyl-ACP methyl ester carboxylesterase
MSKTALIRALIESTAILSLATATLAAQPADPSEPTGALQLAPLDGVELEYEIGGETTGEPVLLIHAGVLADWFAPLMTQPGLSDRFQLVRYHRIGYGDSSRPTGPVSISDQAAHARMLLEHLGIQRAHIVGHSSSADIALQLALDAPDVVASLTLMEPARPDGPLAAASSPQRLAPAFELFRSGDRAGAVDAFMQAVTGPEYRSVVDQALPGAVAQAERDAVAFFGTELPSLGTWSFTREDAARVTPPTLMVRGADSGPVFLERHELLLAWLPNVEPIVLPRATHLLHLQNPQAFADALSDFLARHPIVSRSGAAF